MAETNSQPLLGKVALVTGASRGIGRAIAVKLALGGCDVAVNYYNSHREAASLCEEIRQMGRASCAVQANVADPARVDDLGDQVCAHFGRVDFLISNAASGVLKPARELTLKHWRWCLETNALALNLLAQRFLPHMPRGGRIIALSSIGAQRAIPDYGFVGASKAALESLVRTLAQECGPAGVQVNAVSAGPVDTDALRAFSDRETLLAEFARRAPAGQPLTPEQIADAVYLLCLPEAERITGHTLVVDGGYSVVAG